VSFIGVIDGQPRLDAHAMINIEIPQRVGISEWCRHKLVSGKNIASLVKIENKFINAKTDMRFECTPHHFDTTFQIDYRVKVIGKCGSSNMTPVSTTPKDR